MEIYTRQQVADLFGITIRTLSYWLNKAKKTLYLSGAYELTY